MTDDKIAAPTGTESIVTVLLKTPQKVSEIIA